MVIGLLVSGLVLHSGEHAVDNESKSVAALDGASLGMGVTVVAVPICVKVSLRFLL